MTPQELKDIRHRLDLSQNELALIIGLTSDRNIRRWEDGEKVIPNIVVILLDLIIRFPVVRDHLSVKQDKVLR